VNGNGNAVQTAVPALSGIATLSAAPLGTGAIGLPASWCMGALGFRRSLLADLVPDQLNGPEKVVRDVDRVKPAAAKKQGTTNIRINYNHMTRVSANGDGGSGPQPLREHPPA
jgi:hypothetical protein